jgi:hypothetical protein
MILDIVGALAFLTMLLAAIYATKLNRDSNWGRWRLRILWFVLGSMATLQYLKLLSLAGW